MKLPNRPPDIELDLSYIERVKKYIVEDNQGRRVAYSWRGDPAGVPTFFMHGSPGSSVGPLPSHRCLYLMGVCAVSVDRPGYGHSDPLPGRTVAAGVRDVELVADALAAERFNVMGRSGGGPYALGCAALLGSRVASVATLAGIAPFHLLEGGSKATTDDNASMYAATETAEGLRELERTYERLAKGIRADSNHLLQHLDPDLRRADKEILSAANLMALTRFGHHDGMRQGAAGWLADSNAAAHDWGFELDFSTPAFIWSGQDDGFTPPEHGEALHQRLANSALLQTDGAAHFTALATMPYLLAMQRNFYQADVNDRPGKNSADQLTLFMRSEQTTHIAQSIGHTAIWHTADHPNDVIYRL